MLPVQVRQLSEVLQHQHDLGATHVNHTWGPGTKDVPISSKKEVLGLVSKLLVHLIRLADVCDVDLGKGALQQLSEKADQ